MVPDAGALSAAVARRRRPDRGPPPPPDRGVLFERKLVTGMMAPDGGIMNFAITRRRMLWLLVGLGGAAGLARIARVFPFNSRSSGSLEAFFDRPDSARRIGAAYLRLHPQEADAASLRRSFASAPGGAAGSLEAMGAGEFAGWIRDRRRGDFRDGRTVAVDGWILSITEARLCALLFLG